MKPVPPAPAEEPLEEYQLILQNNLNELFQLQWDYSAIESLKRIFSSSRVKNNISTLKTALLVVETIVTNRIKLRLHIERIVKTVTTLSVDQWMNELNKIVDEQGTAKSVQVLLQELARENPSMDIVKLEEQYRTVIQYYETQTSRWTETDIQQRHVSSDQLYRIAIIIRAAQLHKQYRPRDIQILSLLLLIENQGHGRLAQIRTGEGKSIVVAMCKYRLTLSYLNQRKSFTQRPFIIHSVFRRLICKSDAL